MRAWGQPSGLPSDRVMRTDSQHTTNPAPSLIERRDARMAWAISQKLGPTAKAALLVHAFHCAIDGELTLSRSEAAVTSGLSVYQIDRALSTLTQAGLLVRGSDGVRRLELPT